MKKKTTTTINTLYFFYIQWKIENCHLLASHNPNLSKWKHPVWKEAAWKWREIQSSGTAWTALGERWIANSLLCERLSVSKVNDLSAYSSDQSSDTTDRVSRTREKERETREWKCKARRKNERADNAADHAWTFFSLSLSLSRFLFVVAREVIVDEAFQPVSWRPFQALRFVERSDRIDRRRPAT